MELRCNTKAYAVKPVELQRLAKVDSDGNPERDSRGNPVLELDEHGNPIAVMGQVVYLAPLEGTDGFASDQQRCGFNGPIGVVLRHEDLFGCFKPGARFAVTITALDDALEPGKYQPTPETETVPNVRSVNAKLDMLARPGKYKG